MSATSLKTLTAVYENWTRALFLIDVVLVNKQAATQANVDAAINAVNATGLLIVNPKTTSSVDGENYDWNGFKDTIVRNLKTLEEAMQRASGTFQLSMQMTG